MSRYKTGIGTLTLVVFLGFLMNAAYAQGGNDEHTKHHPGGATSNTSGVPGPKNKGGPMGGKMKQMMEQMGVPKPKDLYPSLMSFPDLTLEKRIEIKKTAQIRMQSGINLMSVGLDELLKTTRYPESVQMQEAIAKVREGISQYTSGVAAHRALTEGKSPRQVALLWFKKEMNLLPSVSSTDKVLGGPYFHLTIIVIFLVFFIFLVWMYFAKMRRASALINSLSTTNNGLNGSISPDNSSKQSSAQTDSNMHGTKSKSDNAIQESSLTTAKPKFPLMRSLTVPYEHWKGKLRVCRIFQETPDVKTFRLAAIEGVALPFTYFPGQFVTITADIEGTSVRRSYTIASTPTQLHYCGITIKREDKGAMSRYLHDEVKEGDLLDVMGPNGKFTFTGDESSSIVLIAGGVGITPMMGVIRYLTDLGWHHDIYLLYCCRTTSDFIFRDELEQLQQRHPNVHVFATMTRSSGTVWMGLKGRFNANLIAHLVPEITKRRIHVCGPPTMMEAMLGFLEELEVPDENVFTESFGPATKPVQEQIKTSEELEHSATVSFKGASKSLPILANQTVLDVAEENGIAIDYSCKVGQCGLCKIKLLSGSVTMECDDALSADEKEQGYILACQAKAKDNIEVDV